MCGGTATRPRVCLGSRTAPADPGGVPPGPRQYLSIRYTERLAEAGAVTSVGSKGDSYDNAMAESVIGLYKTELIYNETQGPWRTVEDVELATLGWVHWWNTKRLLEPLGWVPPVEFEQTWLENRTLRRSQGHDLDEGGIKTADNDGPDGVLAGLVT